MGFSLYRTRRGQFPRLTFLLGAALLQAALLWAAAQPALADPPPHDTVPDAIQRRVEDYFADRFVYPDTSEWVFNSIEPYPGGSKIVCGTVNYQNAMRKYVGAKHFYAILDDSSISSIGIDEDESEDRSGEAAFKMKTLCQLR
jgi:hypothetical protein